MGKTIPWENEFPNKLLMTQVGLPTNSVVSHLSFNSFFEQGGKEKLCVYVDVEILEWIEFSSTYRFLNNGFCKYEFVIKPSGNSETLPVWNDEYLIFKLWEQFSTFSFIPSPPISSPDNLKYMHQLLFHYVSKVFTFSSFNRRSYASLGYLRNCSDM